MQTLFRNQSQHSQTSKTLTFSFNDHSPEKSSYLELDLLNSAPSLSSKDFKFMNKRSSVTKFEGTLESLDAPQSPKFMSHRAHTLQIFKSSLHHDKERDAKQKRTVLREFIKRTDSPTIVNNLLDRGKKEVTKKKTKDKSKGIMFINELWANKYEKKTIKAAQLDKELLQLDTHYLQTVKRKADARMFEKKKTMTIDSSGQLRYQTQTEPDNEIKLLHKDSQGVEPEFLVKSHRDAALSSHKRDCSLPYLVQLQTDTSLHRGISDGYKPLPIVKFNKVASSPAGVMEVSEQREDEERVSPHSNFLLDNYDRSSPISELMNKSIRKESLLKSPKQKKSPNLKLALNHVLNSGSESPNLSPLTLSPKTKKHMIEKHMKLNVLIDQCTNELGDKGDIVNSMMKLQQVFVSPRSNVLKKIEASSKANMVESCRSAIQMRIKMEKSLTQS